MDKQVCCFRSSGPLLYLCYIDVNELLVMTRTRGGKLKKILPYYNTYGKYDERNERFNVLAFSLNENIKTRHAPQYTLRMIRADVRRYLMNRKISHVIICKTLGHAHNSQEEEILPILPSDRIVSYLGTLASEGLHLWENSNWDTAQLGGRRHREESSEESDEGPIAGPVPVDDD